MGEFSVSKTVLTDSTGQQFHRHRMVGRLKDNTELGGLEVLDRRAGVSKSVRYHVV